ncbi:hypothetical protein [Rhodococcus jostii]|uniref:hypothetical protein n=1 Tax=Rhodococcus jostii TaxID=132919 RepID=UPI003634F445
MSDADFAYRFDLTAKAINPGESSGRGVTPAMVRKELEKCFNCTFPIPGAPDSYPSLYEVLNLQAGFAARVQLIEVDPREPTWTFEALPGHFDGPGSTIRFFFYDDGTRIHLVIEAKVIRGSKNLPDWYNKLTAQSMWQAFIQQATFNVCAHQHICSTNLPGDAPIDAPDTAASDTPVGDNRNGG